MTLACDARRVKNTRVSAKHWAAWSAGMAGTLAIGAAACSASGVLPASGDGNQDSGTGATTSPIDAGDTNYGDPTDAGATSACGDASTPENCGSCGVVCPGLDASSDNVLCDTTAAKPACSISCQGENYDVDDNAANGCEVKDAPLGNHTTETALSLGSFSCHDDSSAQNIMGAIPSDTRVHEDPAVDGFSTTSGSAPDYFTLFGSGGTCVDDINMTLTVTGSTAPTCYMLSAVTDQGTYSCNTSVTGTCSFSEGSGSYSDNSTIVMSVTNTCSTATDEFVSYVITGHL
jgi:hypothetical protein